MVSKHLYRVDSWLERWYLWFLDYSGVNDNKNLWRLYHRSLTISGIEPFIALKSLARLNTSARRFGYAFAYELSLLSCLDHLRDYLDFLEEISVTNLIFKLHLKRGDSVSALERSSIKTIISKAIEKKILIILSGSPLLWKSTGALDLSLNSKTFTLIPDLRVQQGALTNISRELFTVEYDSNILAAPCSRRMNLVIIPSGSIYPCAGLVGYDQWELGKLEQPIENMAVCDSKVQKSLANLIKYGPNVVFNQFKGDQNGLPAACNAHRAMLGDSQEYNRG